MDANSENSAICNEYNNVWKCITTDYPKFKWKELNKCPVY